MFQNIISSLFGDEADNVAENPQDEHCADEVLLNPPGVTVTVHSDDDTDSEGYPARRTSDGDSVEGSSDDESDDENRRCYLRADSQGRKLDKDRWVEDAKKGEFDELILQKRQRRVARDDSNLHLNRISDDKERNGSDSSG